MAKFPTYPTILNEVLAFSTKDLKKLNILKQDFETRSTIYFTSRNPLQKGEKYGNIGIHVYTIYGHNYIELDYQVNSQNIKYKIELELFPSNLGVGFVTYFICPQTGKRCSKLYLHKEYFVSKYAISGSCYSLQTESKKTRNGLWLIRAFQKCQKITNRYRKEYMRNVEEGVMSTNRIKVEDAFKRMDIYDDILSNQFRKSIM